jgi:hypothetical protein
MLEWSFDLASGFLRTQTDKTLSRLLHNGNIRSLAAMRRSNPSRSSQRGKCLSSNLKPLVRSRDAIIHLLTLGAFINTNNIGEGLFSLYSQQTNRPDWMNSFLDHGVWDSEKFQDTIVRLSSVSLVTIDLMSNDARISFHPLVAEWLKLRIDLSSRAQSTEEAIRVVRLFVN